MSLTRLVSKKEVRDGIKEFFSPPRVRHPQETAAPRLTDRASLIGTAFDYLFRFELERMYPDATSGSWIAEIAPSSLEHRERVQPHALRDEVQAVGYDIEDLKAEIDERLRSARKTYERFLDTDSLDTPVLKAVLDLARLDSIYRPGPLDLEFDTYPEDDLKDLRQLHEAIPREDFDFQDVHLNPAFGSASELVGGADADLIADQTLIEIKTWTTPSLKGELWGQLIGYAILNELAEEGAPTDRIETVGIYWSRHAHLWTHPIEDLYVQDNFSNLVEWFTTVAEAMMGPPGQGTAQSSEDPWESAASGDIAEGLLRIATEGGSDAFMIARTGTPFVQFAGDADAEKWLMEAVSNKFLPEDEQLPESKIEKIKGLGFEAPEDHNFRREVPKPDAEYAKELESLVMQIFEEVYEKDPSDTVEVRVNL